MYTVFAKQESTARALGLQFPLVLLPDIILKRWHMAVGKNTGKQ